MIHWTWILDVGMVIGILYCTAMMFRPINSGGGDFGDIFEFMFRLGWLVPIFLITTVYFMILYFAK